MDPTKPADNSTSPVDNKPVVTPDDNKSASNEVELAKQLGEREAQIKQLQGWVNQVVPIMKVIDGDPELFKTVNKKLGGADQSASDDKKGDDKAVTTPVTPDPTATESRQAIVLQMVNNFLDKEGISKYDSDTSKKVQEKIANQLAELVDPKGNKTLPQVFEDISLTRLPKYLENSWNLVKIQMQSSKDPLLSSIGTSSSLGVLGSVAAGESSDSQDENTLTSAEKKTAAAMGVSEDKYLENKKNLAKKRAEDQY